MSYLQKWALSLGLACVTVCSAKAGDTLHWRTNQNRVSADIKAWELPQVLERVATITGWKVYLEPGTTHTTSTKFKDLPPGDALHLLLGGLNYALIPQTNAGPTLFVFQTTMQRATELVPPAKSLAKVIPNELIVRLKPGAKVDDLARALGAKVVGRIDGLNSYRLQFSDASSADAGHEKLDNKSDVASVDNN